jgi:hypothetical protein
MNKTVHAGLKTYLPFGGVAAFLVVLQILILIRRGSQKDVWMAIFIIIGLYSLFCLFMSRHRLIVSPDGIARADLFCRRRYVAWGDIRKRVVLCHRDQRPGRLDLFGDSDRLLLSIPLRFYSQADCEYLMRDVFKLERSAWKSSS